MRNDLKFQYQKDADSYLSGLDVNVIGGVDEVGRGCFSGPVVAACVILNKDHGIVGIKDSKKLSPKRREYLSKEISNKGWCSFGVVDSGKIDECNILEATLLAVRQAIRKMSETRTAPSMDFLICDGGLDMSGYVTCPTIAVVKGDQWFESIGAASIVAKVYRDKLMLGYHHRWPEYGFDTNQGYGTKFHIEAIKSYGLTPIHRRSFGMCKTAKVRI